MTGLFFSTPETGEGGGSPGRIEGAKEVPRVEPLPASRCPVVVNSLGI